MFVFEVKIIMELSEQQQIVVDSEPESMCIIACAGSGKTETAIQKLIKLRTDMANHRGYIALLSFTNTAIKTFREGYYGSVQKNIDRFSNRVCIETLDSFITKNILHPHSFHVMGCKSSPFLISGKEAFLRNSSFTYWYETKLGNKQPVPREDINNVTIRVKDNKLKFFYRIHNELFSINNGVDVTKRLANIGAYTHELGKFWVLQTLAKNKNLLSAIVNRFPIIIVDEAQDIDLMHGLILDTLHKAGSKLILIGDPNQAIFEFSGADGSFLTSFSEKIKNSYSLSTNYRSIPNIVLTANSISKRDDTAYRQQENADYGIYYILYNENQTENVIDNFISKVDSIGMNLDNSAVLYRGWSGIDKLLRVKELGQGKTKQLALATIKRDKNKNYKEAFDIVVSCLSGLLTSLPINFVQIIYTDPEFKLLKKMIWTFVRNPLTGLPSGGLLAKKQWHPTLKSNITNLLTEIKKNYGYETDGRIGHIISSKKLSEEALIADSDLLKDDGKKNIRIDTVHQVKGESLEAVLYMPKEKKHLREMMNGTETELGRIGYVALTRARNFFVIGIPNKWHKEFAKQLLDLNIKPLSIISKRLRMDRCYLCGEEFNQLSVVDHREHIIQQAIEGEFDSE